MNLGRLGKRGWGSGGDGHHGNFTFIRTLPTEMRQEKAAEDRYRFGLELLKSGDIQDG